MLFHSSLSPTETQPATILTGAINHQTTPMRLFKVSLPGHYRTSFTCLSTIRSTVPVLQGEGRDDEEKQVEASKVKWVEIGPDITDEQKQAMAELPSKMTKRCKALMKQIICCSSQEGNLPLLLAAWVKVMRPKRADWLSVIKEMKSSENPLLIKDVTNWHFILHDTASYCKQLLFAPPPPPPSNRPPF
uniref:Pentatricopeptide repeat-containing protein At1g01970 n=1 Tax=Anthurium amnicola TaxID=1678845 RepID=A0A1D1Y4K1_9ARAE